MKMMIPVKMKECLIIKSVVITLFMLVKFYLIGMSSFRSWVGVISRQYGSPRIWSIIVMSHLRYRRVLNTIWKLPMTKWTFSTKLLKTGRRKNGKRRSRNTIELISILWLDWESMVSFQKAHIVPNFLTHSFIMAQTVSILSWSSKFWVSISWKLSRDTTIRASQCPLSEGLQDNVWLDLIIFIGCVR